MSDDDGTVIQKKRQGKVVSEKTTEQIEQEKQAKKAAEKKDETQQQMQPPQSPPQTENAPQIQQTQPQKVENIKVEEEKKVKAPAVDDEDEDSFKVKKGTYVSEQEQIQLWEKDGKEFKLQDSLAILNGKQPCIFDLKTQKWQFATNEEAVDTAEMAKNIAKGVQTHIKTFEFPDNCSTVFFNDNLNYNKIANLIVTGGSKHGNVLSKGYGLSFGYIYKNGLKDIFARQQVVLPELPTPRYLHQSAGVIIEGKTYLIVMGGKDSRDSKESFKSVYKLKIHDFIAQREDISLEIIEKMNEIKIASVNLWQECASMTGARSMFASTVIDNRYVFVYGGIDKGQIGMNQLSHVTAERYDSHLDHWTAYQIQNALNLSSFGWCQGEDPNVLYILGGSDGYTLQGSLFKINFSANKPGIAEDLGVEYSQPICMNKLGFYENKLKNTLTLYSFGGSNSDGMCYKCDFVKGREPVWVELTQSYLSLFASSEDSDDKKFIFKTSVQFS